ncbi:MAG: sulfurtransferase complex subunit TusD [Oleiphilus sp.]|nr:MAG: sulfurtransferase complex subunit TusD [Oleiphilus sp.]
MKLSILVLGSPYNSQAAYSALRYTQAALDSGHEIYRVFFYQDGVHACSNLPAPPQDEFNTYEAWQTLQEKHELDCVTCIAAAARRGVLNEEESKRHNLPAFNLATQFSLSGLGQLIEANAESDRLVTFGA